MSGKVAQEIVQTKPFVCREEEAFLNLARTHEHIMQGFSELFREFHISTTQYNVLRILRGAGSEGLNCTEAAQRLISHDPDITRLFDRLEVRGLIARSRSTADRRVVQATITEQGLDILIKLDQPVFDLHAQQMQNLNAGEMEELIRLLELMRP